MALNPARPSSTDADEAAALAKVRTLLVAANPRPELQLTPDEARWAEVLLASIVPPPAEMSATAQIEHRLTPAQARRVAVTRRRRRGRQPRRLAAFPKAMVSAAVIAVAATAALVVVTTVRSQPATAAPTTPQLLPFAHGTRSGAVAALSAAAEHVSSQPFGTGPVTYSRVQSWALNVDVHRRHASTTLNTAIVQTWYALDGTTREQETNRITSPLVGLSPQGHDAASTTTVDPPGVSPNRNADIPTGPTAVVQVWLRDHVRFPGEFSADVTYGGDITQRLAEGNTSPAQDGALYRVLATLPGVFDAGHVTDRTGRPGQAVGIVTSGPGSLTTGTEYLIFDSVTGRLLEIDNVWGPNPPPGLHLRPGPIVAQFEILLDSQRVSALGSHT